MPVKVVYIVSDIQKSLTFEWLVLALDRRKIDLQFILLGKTGSPLSFFLKEYAVPCVEIAFEGKGSLFRAWMRTLFALHRLRPGVIHTHLYYGTMIGLSAGWVLRIKKRIHTRHHGSLHHKYFPRAVFVDKLINRLSTHIIVLSQNQLKIVRDWEGVAAEKISLVPHGFDLTYFSNVSAELVNLLRRKYNIPENAFPVIGAISRYTEWKGVHYIIPAFKELVKKYPGARLVLANAQGDYERQIHAQLQELPESAVVQIEFESDVATLYHLFDIFVHVPVDAYSEAFGQTYVEALAAGVPSIFTLSGVAGDFIEHEKNALVVGFQDSVQIMEAMQKLVESADLREAISREGRNSSRKFSVMESVRKMEALYLP